MWKELGVHEASALTRVRGAQGLGRRQGAGRAGGGVERAWWAPTPSQDTRTRARAATLPSPHPPLLTSRACARRPLLLRAGLVPPGFSPSREGHPAVQGLCLGVPKAKSLLRMQAK